jgi:hypothetical protein
MMDVTEEVTLRDSTHETVYEDSVLDMTNDGGDDDDDDDDDDELSILLDELASVDELLTNSEDDKRLKLLLETTLLEMLLEEAELGFLGAEEDILLLGLGFNSHSSL